MSGHRKEYKYMAETVMALYFEDTAVKLLVARGRKAEQWQSVPLAPGLVTGGVIVDEAKVSEKIKELFAGVKHSKMAAFISGKGKIIVGLSGRDSLYRVISLPVLEKSMLAEAVRREAGRVLPVSLDQLYLAYQRIPGNDNETRVFVAAFPKKSADVLIKTMRLAGIAPRVLDLAPLALCISVNEPRAIIADAGFDSLNIMVMAERVPQVIRSLSLPGEGKSLADNMATVSEEFSRTVAFYNSSHQQAPLDSSVPVFVSGDLAKNPALWPALVGQLNSKVSILPSAVQYPADFPANDFVVNLALAAKELSLEKEHANYSLVNLNALPPSALPVPFNFYRVLVPVVGVVGIVVVFLMWNNYSHSKNNTAAIQSQLTAEQNLITINNKAIAADTEQNRVIQAQIQPITDQANIFTNKIKNLTTARSLADSDVNQIIALTPAAVDVNALIYNAGSQSLSGVSGTYQDILSYAQALRDKGGFNVVVSTISYASGTIGSQYNFTLQLN
jgi:type IV pilus assembly protein PilM